MSRYVVSAVAVTLIALGVTAAYVVLAVAGGDTGPFLTYVGTAIVPTLAALVVADRVGESIRIGRGIASEVDTVKKQTNGPWSEFWAAQHKGE